jgi:2-polyprenyl-3-methyl-5-hydroxy-6-metoxy-1,4-benzoquinol methylase
MAIILYELGVISHDTMYGREYYERMDRKEALEDCKKFSEVILANYDQENIIEFGCGTGRLLYDFYNNDVEVHGLELSKIAQDVSQLPSGKVETHDLKKPYYPKQTYDIVLCVEVLEHLPEYATETIVSSIARSAPVAIVTAATPGQGGTHHVNEQPHTYWMGKFEETGMSYDPKGTKDLRDSLNLNELTWIEDNIMVFKKE